jgi:predicted nucleic acid-binding protein
MKVYLDTNAFYFFFFEDKDFTEGIKKVFKKIQEGKYEALTSCLTLDELAYTILLRLIEKKYKKHPLDVIRENRSVILEFIDEIHSVFDTIFSFDNIQIIDVNLNIMSFIPIMMEENLLLPRDSIHLRLMLDNGCDKILSTDTDFDHIEEIDRIKPEDF